MGMLLEQHHSPLLFSSLLCFTVVALSYLLMTTFFITRLTSGLRGVTVHSILLLAKEPLSLYPLGVCTLHTVIFCSGGHANIPISIFKTRTQITCFQMVDISVYNFITGQKSHNISGMMQINLFECEPNISP